VRAIRSDRSGVGAAAAGGKLNPGSNIIQQAVVGSVDQFGPLPGDLLLFPQSGRAARTDSGFVRMTEKDQNTRGEHRPRVVIALSRNIHAEVST